MKNFEKYIDEILEECLVFPCKISKKYVCDCRKTLCSECSEKTRKWLLEEYVEPIQLTHDEYVILKNLPDKFKYITRNSFGNVEIYECKPIKKTMTWTNIDETQEESFDFFNHLFQFVKWEDEPYEIAKLIEGFEKEHGDA